MKKIKHLKIAIVYLLAAFVFSFVITPQCSYATNVSQKRKQTQEKIQQLKLLESAEKSKLYKNQRKLEDTSNNLQASRNRYNDIESRLNQMEYELSNATAEFNSIDNTLKERIRQVFKSQRTGMFELILSAKDLNSLLDVIYFERLIIKNDYKHMMEVKQKAQKIAQMKKDVENQKKMLARSIKDINSQQRDIEKAIDDISFVVQNGEFIGIMGASGSGKTTLIKLLLGFYSPVSGTIHVGDKLLEEYSVQWWRGTCGTVMQDGYIFSDTIARNICMCMEHQVDEERMKLAAETANIADFIETLPLRYNSKIGQEGLGLSQGQKQRILIARAVYKNPSFIFFDEATNSLDASNEKVITNQLNHFFTGRTAVVVAHRLSTVRHAHQIIVLDHGHIVERGSHETLIAKQGFYYNLIKDQLELGNE